MCLAIEARRLRRSQLEAWERELRDLADGLARYLRETDRAGGGS